MRIGILGTGMMGRNHHRIYSNRKSVDQVRVFVLNRVSTQEVAEQNGTVATESANDLLRQVDAVSIFVPKPKHFQTAKTALENEVSILVEGRSVRQYVRPGSLQTWFLIASALASATSSD